MLHKVLKGLYHFTVYAIGILVLSAAVVVTVIRLLLPDVGIYRGEIEAWVSSYMGYPVVIRSLDASWEGWVPHLQLSDIDLLNKAGTQTITHFDAAQIKIAPLQTVLKRRIMPKQLTIRGFELAVARLTNGAIYIEGVNISEAKKNQPADNELAEWLFKQEQITIENGRIEWLDIKHRQRPVLLTDVSIQLRSDGKRLQAEGSARLPENYGETMDFSFDAFGNLLSSDWSADLYLAGHDINPDNWYKGYRPVNFNVSGGKADIKVWSNWRKARLSNLDGELHYKDFETRIGDNKLDIRKLAYRFFGERINEDGWQFRMNLDQLLTENGSWPKTKITISGTRADTHSDYRYSAAFNYLKLDDLSPFISSLSFLPETVKSRLADLRIHGQLSMGKMIYDPTQAEPQRFRFDTRFNNIEADLGVDLPGFSNLSGQLYGSLNEGLITLATEDVQLRLESLQDGNLHLSRLAGDIKWQKEPGQWRLSSDKLQISNTDVAATLHGSISKSAGDASPFIDVIADLENTALEHIPAYLPRSQTFKLAEWMERSVLGGELSSATALFRGYSKDFPFDQQEGRFMLLLNTSNTTLDYSALWPPVDNIEAEVLLDGRKMQANIHHAKIFGADITTAKATIANVMKPEKLLELGGHIRGETRDLSLFILQSPLHKDPGLDEITRSLESGNIALDLDLSIPIRQSNKTVELDGSLSLHNSVLKSPLKNLQLDNVEGKIHFTRYSVKSETLQANFAGNPVKLSISGSKMDTENPPAIQVSGLADETFVADRLLEYFPAMKNIDHYIRERMTGESEWRLTLSNVPTENPDSRVKKLQLETRLDGVNVDFPAPLGKAHYRSRPLTITSYLGLDSPGSIHIEYDNVFNSELLMDADKKLQTINVHFGAGPIPDNQAPGMHISGTTEELVATQWWELIRERQPKSDKDGPSVLDAGVSVNVQTNVLELLHQQFADVDLAIQKHDNNWHFALDSKSIAGDILLSTDAGQNNEVSFQLDRLHMAQESAAPGGSNAGTLSPQGIPAISGTVKHFVYDKFALGELTLQTRPLPAGLTIEQLSFNKDAMQIDGSGNWLRIADKDYSSFKINLHADEMESMLTTFDYNQTPVKKGETTLNLQARWPGSPMDFGLEKMNGTLDMQVSKGQLLDVNPSAGRLFGLFSLQTLARRLTLDFSDIFGKGLAFDKIEGSFNIDNGNAYTNDLYMRGPAANVAVSGRTGLSEQDYDQIVTVTPQFSDNLPVAGVLLGPVGIGLGAVFYLAGQMFDSVHNSIDKLLQYQYTITGNWNHPVIEKIKHNKTDQQLSEAAG